jgi:hypothetical protein
MAAQATSSLVPDVSTDPRFQGACVFVDAVITGGGWVNTADTGQLTLASAAHPTVANTKVGYRIYRMNDALQATRPVFLRVDYGSGSAAATFALSITIGSGTDGAGNITGTALPELRVSPTSGSGQTFTSTCFGSADTNRLQLMLFSATSTSANVMLCLSLERSKDAAGADTNAGLLLTYSTADVSLAGFQRSQYIVLPPGSNPPTELGVTVALPNANSNPTSFDGNVGIGLFTHFRGVAQPPGIGGCAVHAADFAAGAQFTMVVYGVSRTYQLCLRNNQLGIPNGDGTLRSRPGTYVGILYE